MRHTQLSRFRWLALAVVALLILAATTVALARVAAGYDLSWWTVDGGGGASRGGAYALDGTIGQPDAAGLSGGSYTLNSGYWGGISHVYTLYLPAVSRIGGAR